MLFSIDSFVRVAMLSRYICFCGPLPVMIASIGGRVGDEA